MIRWDDLTDEQIDRLAAGEPPEGAERMSAGTPLQIQSRMQRRKRERRVIAQSTPVTHRPRRSGRARMRRSCTRHAGAFV